jgi:glycosyltransferase involved in cell wall biosynthesis
MTAAPGPLTSATVLYLHHATVVGGAERVMLTAMDQARERGLRPVLACPGDGRFATLAREAGFAVVPCALESMRDSRRPGDVARYALSVARVGRRVRDVCSRHDVRLVHAGSPVAGLYAMRASRSLGLPVLLHVHDAQPPKRARRLAIRWQARRATRLVCVSRCVRAMVVSVGVPSDKTSLLANGIDGAFFGPAPAPIPEVRGRGPHIGLFSPIVPWKGHHVFLEAAARLARSHPDARFYVVGTLVDPDHQRYLDDLMAAAARPPLDGRVSFTGFQPDVTRWMAAMDAVAHTSVAPEAFGLVIAEAMALGKPVVATNVGGPAEIVEDGVTGRLVPPGDPVALADALLAVLGDRAMMAHAAAAARARFTPQAFGDRLMSLYHDAVA